MAHSLTPKQIEMVAKLLNEFPDLLRFLGSLGTPESGYLPVMRLPEPEGGGKPRDGPDQLVSLDQVAASVGRAKKTLYRYRSRMPPPCVPGGRGRPHFWRWSVIRPWLVETFHVPLGEVWPYYKSV